MEALRHVSSYRSRRARVATFCYGRCVSPDDVKALRRELRLTARRLAEQLGVDEATVFAWERGDGFPTKRYCDAMRALREAATAAPPPPPPDPAASPLQRLADPDLWCIVRKLAASPELFEAVRTLAARYPDPGED
jgi:DNA-binding transcriptional regulator YiaG